MMADNAAEASPADAVLSIFMSCVRCPTIGGLHTSKLFTLERRDAGSSTTMVYGARVHPAAAVLTWYSPTPTIGRYAGVVVVDVLLGQAARPVCAPPGDLQRLLITGQITVATLYRAVQTLTTEFSTREEYQQEWAM
jgi:hypothetical protein